MDENHQNVTNNNLITTENKIWLPPSFTNGKAPVTLAPKKRGIKWGFVNRTVFDWIMLVSQVLSAIAIPFVVTMLGLYATQQVTQQQTQLSERQHQVDLHIAEDQQRATILQTYIDNIQDLLLNHNLLKSSPFNPSNPYYDVSTLARSRTLTALQGLDPERKVRLLTFLYESELIGFEEIIPKTIIWHPPIIKLSEADLSGTDFSSTYRFCPQLSGINLLGANLRGTNLNCAQLVRAELSITDLRGANLNSATLLGADLYAADLIGAHVRADLRGADLSHAYLIGADLLGANLECNDQDGENRCTDLSFANLSGANLSGANLSGADLRYAYLTQQQLDQVSLCKNAILPPGLTCHHN